MLKIHPLSPEIISKIAAGEVIERPAFAVKELIENAIDANASDIRIYIEQGGVENIMVVDNGVGMSKEDLKLSTQHHTTSKLRHAEDLIGIHTFGFRGEALSSLAAVSNVTIRSREIDTASGNEIIVEHGRVASFHSIGMPYGTTVFAKHLFADIPARKKFLKSSATEFRHIVDIVLQQALTHPDIGFHLFHNKRRVIDVSSKENKTERIVQLMSKKIYQQLIPFFLHESYITLSGFVGHPQLNIPNTYKQYLFINNRPIRDRFISAAIKSAYGTLLDTPAYPLAIINIDLPYEMVDINVHPQKTLVHILNMPFVLEQITLGVQNALKEKNLIFHDFKIFGGRSADTSTIAGLTLKDAIDNRLSIGKQDTLYFQLHNVYIVVPTEKGFLLVDQHAAHERILYNKLEKQLKAKKDNAVVIAKKVQSLELSPTDTEILMEYIQEFEKYGFKIINKKNNIFTITHVPWLFADRDFIEIIQEMIDVIRDADRLLNIDSRTQRLLEYLACRGAIKAGKMLSQEEMKNLIQQLELTDYNATCPHGRPTKVEIFKKQLDTLFKRSK